MPHSTSRELSLYHTDRDVLFRQEANLSLLWTKFNTFPAVYLRMLKQ